MKDTIEFIKCACGCGKEREKYDSWGRKYIYLKGYYRNLRIETDKPHSRTIHTWIRRRKPVPQFCEICNLKSPHDLCNKSMHKYTRNLDDYFYACRKCHCEYDKKMGIKRGNYLGKPLSLEHRRNISIAAIKWHSMKNCDYERDYSNNQTS